MCPESGLSVAEVTRWKQRSHKIEPGYIRGGRLPLGMRQGSAAIFACLVVLALPSAALGSVRHFQGTLTTDPEHPTVKFDVVGAKKDGKFVPAKILNLTVLPDILYQGGCSNCVPPFRYFYIGYGVTDPPIKVVQASKHKGTFFGLDETFFGNTTIEFYTFSGAFKGGTKARGKLHAEASEAGIQYPHGEAQHNWTAHRVAG
jgi:hypothetical protein